MLEGKILDKKVVLIFQNDADVKKQLQQEVTI